MTERKISRRDFVAAGAGAAAAGLVGAGSTCAAEIGPKSRVVMIRRREVLGPTGRPDPEILHEMLNEAVAALFEEDSVAAWRRMVSPSDVVGIKSNVWRYLPTPPVLEEAIRGELLRAGVKPENVAVDDRGVRTNPVFKRATAIINTRPLRTHDWSGLGTSIKNLIMFVPRPQDYHGDACAPLGAIWHLPQLEGKVRLNVLVMLTSSTPPARTASRANTCGPMAVSSSASTRWRWTPPAPVSSRPSGSSSSVTTAPSARRRTTSKSPASAMVSGSATRQRSSWCASVGRTRRLSDDEPSVVSRRSTHEISRRASKRAP